MASGSAQGDAKYVLAVAGRERHEDERLSLLEAIFDPLTKRRLDFVQPGWNCLEVGAGRGSIAAWLAERVGSTGAVVAADLDTTLVQPTDLPNLRVVGHDILNDPLDALGPPGSFDVVHARFLIEHLRENQDKAVARMRDCLKPGGWILLEDHDAATMAAADPAHPLSEAFNKQMEAAERAMRSQNTIDPLAARAMLPRLAHAGFVNLRHEATTRVEPGGGPMATWLLKSSEATRHVMESRGIKPDDGLDVSIRAFADPTFWLLSATEHAARGQKPG